LQTPEEGIYPVLDPDVARRLGNVTVNPQ